MTTEIISNEYEGGRRVCVQKVVYTKADDLNVLGQLQISLARVLGAENSRLAGSGQYGEEIKRLSEAIAAQQLIVDSYPEEKY